ncbi:unnamed protein product [Paramecium sonneborni]|uniref:Uncharacterized protein n=1 Tax=Paramecium sonneborni TaxID=65129 RepID=A0A8S1M4Q6_9CILI|nr:unnamed protein product [Paramecium sonneborni]
MIYRKQTELAIDITNLQEKIMVVIQTIKDENMKRLNSFNEQFKQSFKIENNQIVEKILLKSFIYCITLKANIDQLFLLSKKIFYKSNQNSFLQKMASLNIFDAQSFLSNLQSHLNKSKQLSQGNVLSYQILTDLQTLARFLLQMNNSLPNYDQLKNPQTNILDSVVNEVEFVLNNVVSARLCSFCQLQRIILNLDRRKQFVIVNGSKKYRQVINIINLVSNQNQLKNLQQELNQHVFYQFEIIYLLLVHKMTANQGCWKVHNKNFSIFWSLLKYYISSKDLYK